MGFTMFARCFLDIVSLVLLLFNDNLLIMSHSLILDSSLLIYDVMFLVVSSLDESIVVHSQFHTVVVSSRYTNALLLLVSDFQIMQCQHLWMKSGTSKKRLYIPIDAVFNKQPSGSASALLAFHALTGCDTTSYIANHTKRSSWKIFKENHGLLKNLDIGELTDDTIQSSETFVCRIYNVHRTDSIDAARHLLFSKTGKPEAMAPTSDALRFHLTRIHYQSRIWRNAHCPTPELPAPSEIGWRLVDSELQPVLMTLSPIPDSCLEMVACSCRKQCKTRRCKCQKSGLRCTSMCACQHQMDDQMACTNRHSWRLITVSESCSCRSVYTR